MGGCAGGKKEERGERKERKRKGCWVLQQERSHVSIFFDDGHLEVLLFSEFA